MPGEPIIQFDHAKHEILAHDLAQPVCMVIPGQTPIGQPVFRGKVIGGLTKLEAGALQIAAGAMVGQVGIQMTAGELAEMAIKLAVEVLVRCGDRQANQEREVLHDRQAAAHHNGDDVGRGKILTP